MTTNKVSSYEFFLLFFPILIQSNQQMYSKHLKEKVNLKQHQNWHIPEQNEIVFRNDILKTLTRSVVLCLNLSPRKETTSFTGFLYHCRPHTLTGYLQSGLNTKCNSQEPVAFPYVSPKQHGRQLAGRFQRAFYPHQDTLYPSPCPAWLTLCPQWHCLHWPCDSIPPARAPALAAALDWQLTF